MNGYFRIMLVLIIVLFALTIFFSITGCTYTERIGKAIFNTQPDVDSVLPETPKGQLWQTIKGLTPNWLAIPVIALGA
ncbi:hypothetical protein LCGC14_1984640, partial [marine sediment metagenome]